MGKSEPVTVTEPGEKERFRSGYAGWQRGRSQRTALDSSSSLRQSGMFGCFPSIAEASIDPS